MATRDLPSLLAAARALPPGERLRLAAEIAPEGTQFVREGILRLLDGDDAPTPSAPVGPLPTDRLSLEEVARLHQKLTGREAAVGRPAVLKWGRAGVGGVKLVIRGSGSARFVLRSDWDAWLARSGQDEGGVAVTPAAAALAAALPAGGSLEDQIAAAEAAYSPSTGRGGRGR